MSMSFMARLVRNGYGPLLGAICKLPMTHQQMLRAIEAMGGSQVHYFNADPAALEDAKTVSFCYYYFINVTNTNTLLYMCRSYGSLLLWAMGIQKMSRLL